MLNLSDHWDQACTFLREKEPALSLLIDRFPGQKLQADGLNGFQTLANAIVGQQISVKAAASIWGRFQALTGEVAPDRIPGLTLDQLRGVGLSLRKAEYIQSLAQAFLSGQVRPDLWDSQDDGEVLESLVALRGIGRWTAEMFLIFHLGRPDVLPLDDLGLLRSASLVFGWDYDKKGKELQARAEQWRPWRTAAVWYLWRNLDPEPVAY